MEPHTTAALKIDSSILPILMEDKVDKEVKVAKEVKVDKCNAPILPALA